MTIATYEAEEWSQSQVITVTQKQVSSKYEQAANLMRKFPNTWVSLSKAKNKHTAQSYVWQLQHDSSPTLPVSEFGFRIHEVNGEWWIQAIYLGKEL